MKLRIDKWTREDIKWKYARSNAIIAANDRAFKIEKKARDAALKAEKKHQQEGPIFEPRPMPDGSSLLLDLPAELRNNVYEKLLEDDIEVFLLPTRNATLIPIEGLARTNRQLRSEFTPLAIISPKIIQTTVQNFSFSHIPKFLSTLSDSEISRLTGPTPECRFTIHLTFEDMERDRARRGYLRWFRAFSAARGSRQAAVEFEYVMAEAVAEEILEVQGFGRTSWEKITKLIGTWEGGTEGSKLKSAMDEADREAGLRPRPPERRWGTCKAPWERVW